MPPANTLLFQLGTKPPYLGLPFSAHLIQTAVQILHLTEQSVCLIALALDLLLGLVGVSGQRCSAHPVAAPTPPGAAPGRRAGRRDGRPWPAVRRTWWRHPAPCGPDRTWRGRLRPGLPAIRPEAGRDPRSTASVRQGSRSSSAAWVASFCSSSSRNVCTCAFSASISPFTWHRGHIVRGLVLRTGPAASCAQVLKLLLGHPHACAAVILARVAVPLSPLRKNAGGIPRRAEALGKFVIGQIQCHRAPLVLHPCGPHCAGAPGRTSSPHIVRARAGHAMRT